MDKKDFLNRFLQFENTYLDFPFDDDNWAAVRHKDNKKVFVFVYRRNGVLYLNFKNTPEWATFWRESFEAVSPAYHMNKEHWSTVEAGTDADDEQIIQMVYDSYKLTLSKSRKKK